jgi:hypothetical protein
MESGALGHKGKHAEAMFLRNVGVNLPDYMALQYRIQTFALPDIRALPLH